MIYIIRETIFAEFLQVNSLVGVLKRIMIEFDHEDTVIAKEVLFLLGRYMKLYNSSVVNHGMELNHWISDLATINIGLISAMEDIFFSEKLH
jgi:hypothetical protein